MRTLLNIRDSFNDFIYLIWHWEHWHWLVKYIPLLPAWAWYCLRARSFWFFTGANPTLTFGGFAGESKCEMYAQLPANLIPHTIPISHRIPFSEVERLVTESFTFPVAVKPEIGRMGLMFRKIDTFSDLRHYHLRMEYDYMVQEYVDLPLEVSVFYYRLPDEPRGTITGFVKKEPLTITGNGRSTLRELIRCYPRARYRLDEILLKHKDVLDNILSEGETYTLSEALNLSRGGRLVNVEHEKDDNLLRVFDELSEGGRFYFGRYDIKCASIEDLKAGRNFSILEFNGSGAEPHHIYGNGNTLVQALKILLHHWDVLCRISRANFSKGVPRWKFERGYSFFLESEAYVTRLRQLDVALYNNAHATEKSDTISFVPDPSLSFHDHSWHNKATHEN